MTSLILALACTPFPCDEGELLLSDGSCRSADDAPQPDSTEDSAGDSDPTVEWVTLPDACAGTSTASDPLILRSSMKKGQETPGAGRFAEFIDVHYDADTQIAWGVGQGGGVPVDVSDPDAATALGWLPRTDNHSRYHRIEPVRDELWAVSYRDGYFTLFDPRTPEGIDTGAEQRLDGVEGLATYQGTLYVTSREHGVVAYEVVDVDTVVELSTTAGLSAPWDFSEVDEDGWTYVADNDLGVVPVQLDGSSSTIHEAVDVGGPVLHTELDGDFVYASAGSGGLVILDASEPSTPVEVARLSTGGSAVMSAVDSGLLWVVDHEGLAVYDVSDPRSPEPLAHEITEQFALAVDAHEGRAYVGDWNYIHVYELDESVRAPELDIASSTLLLAEAGGVTETTLTNRGGATLELQGATIGDARVTVQVSASSLEPGESATLRLDFSGGEDLDTSLCLASDDPDGSEREIDVILGDNTLGQPAPDFALQDIDGDTYTLSEQLGHPVVLAYFATW
jgi:hypothetical protein